MANTNVLGANIRERRQNEDLSTKDAAELLGVTTQYLGQVELGRKRPSDKLMVKICDMLNCGVGDLLKEEKSLEKESEEAPVEKTEKPGRNSEGYPDPTAYNAIKNKEGNKLIPGWVYEFSNQKGFVEDFLVMGTCGGSVNGYIVMDQDSPFITESCCRHLYKGKYYFVAPELLMSRPAKYVGQPLYQLEKKAIDDIKRDLAAHLGIDVFIQRVPVNVPSNNTEAEKLLRRTVEDLTIELNNLKAQHQLEMLKLENNILREALGLLRK